MACLPHKAQEKYGGVKDYRASEGRVKIVPYKGSATEVVEDILGGLRSACSYIGATCLKDMNKCAEFNLVNRTHFDQNTWCEEKFVSIVIKGKTQSHFLNTLNTKIN
jgi:hypothetical protein